jgi:hypothetical protein
VLPTIRLNGSLGQQYSETLSETVERKFSVKDKTSTGNEHQSERKMTIGNVKVFPVKVSTKASDTVSHEVSCSSLLKGCVTLRDVCMCIRSCSRCIIHLICIMHFLLSAKLLLSLR